MKKYSFKIDKNIPIPERKPPGFQKDSIKQRQCVYPWPIMKKGDSFLYSKKRKEGTQRSAGNAARNWKNQVGKFSWDFIARQTDEGIRVWRRK